ncbi:MAG: hypothetical protein R3212_03635 [Xanthomonadales bacterium]|nr:hypothetical protein [Xanthomonadales bacterium]
MKQILCSEVESGEFFAGEFFSRAFGDTVPDWGHHLVCFYRGSQEHFVPLTYVNFAQHENVILVGGAVTNGRAFEHVDPEHARQLREIGGPYLQLLRFGFAKFADACDGYFGYTGDERALEVDLQAGFEPTPHQYLIVHFQKPHPEPFKAELIEKIHKLGAF